jgi:2-iminoacetate synthase ThiH
MTKEERSQQLKELAVKGGDHHEAVKIEYDGIMYDSIAEAKEATGMSYYLITKYGKRV